MTDLMSISPAPAGDYSGYVRAAINLLTRIPDDLRTFTVSHAEALSRYRIRRSMLDLALREGLASISSAGGQLFDRHDLENLSMRADQRSPFRKLLAWWGRELDTPGGPDRTFVTEIRANCPDPTHEGECHYDSLDIDKRNILAKLPSDGPQLINEFRIALRRDWPASPPPLAHLFDEYADIEFLRLPAALRYEGDLVEKQRVADCQRMAQILVRRAPDHGFEARESFGLAVAPPFGFRHHWPEFLIEGVWTPVDPLMNRTLLRLGTIDPRSWQPYSSIGGILARLAESREAIVLHNAQYIPATIHCRRYSYAS
jgi:hypothetical protein